MFNTASTVNPFLETLQSLDVTFDLGSIPGFPIEEYNSRQTIYSEAEGWYNGTYLEDLVESVSGKPVERYPVKVHPIPNIVSKHVATLFGEVNQDDRPLVYPRVIPPPEKEKGESEEGEGEEGDTNLDKANYAELILNQVWYENNGRTLQLTNGLYSQIYGGCIFRASYDPHDPMLSIPVRVEAIHPKCFIGVPSRRDMFVLDHAWIVTIISVEEAKGYFIKPSPEATHCTMVEEYTPKSYKCWIDGQIPQRSIVNPITGREELIQIGGNEFGFVSIVYIPHIRTLGFYGDNAFDNLKGLILEYNRRFADFGDAVSADSHSYVGMRNVSGSPQPVQIARNLYAINLGSTPSLTGNEPQPDMFPFRTQAASAQMGELLGLLYDQIRRDSYIPAIADGEDEGSQRSGLTLAMRMWPLIQHTGLERHYWTSGLTTLNRMILKMLEILGESKITKEHSSMIVKIEWSPVLPRDREMEVNEAVARMTAKLASPQYLIERLGDVEDPDAEVERMLEFWKDVQEITAPPQPFGAPSGKPSGKSKPKPVPADTQTKKSQASESESKEE